MNENQKETYVKSWPSTVSASGRESASGCHSARLAESSKHDNYNLKKTSFFVVGYKKSATEHTKKKKLNQ